jgi:hypothetical protein
MEEVFAKSSTTACVGDYSNCAAQAQSFLPWGTNSGCILISYDIKDMEKNESRWLP